jgi:hypothetical protein
VRLTDPSMTTPAPSRLLRGRYQPLAPLCAAPSPLFLALDTTTQSPCVLKQINDLPLESVAIRERVRDLPGTITFKDSFTTADGTFLVLDYIQGESLATRHQRLLLQSQSLAWETVLDWAIRAARIVEDCHAVGVVHGALKPGHWYLDTNGELYLLDFSRARRTIPATHQQLVAAEIADFGTWLYTLATDYPYLPPSNPPRWERPLPSRLNPRLPPAFDTFLNGCRSEAFADMRSVRETLIQMRHPVSVAPCPVPKCPSPENKAIDALKSVIVELGNTLAEDVWRGQANQTLYDGTAGMVRVLAYLAETFNVPAWQEAAWTSAHHLAEQPTGRTASLFHGQAGIAFALGCAARHLQTPELYHRALERARWVATRPIAHHDLTRGAAGRLHLYLGLWQATGERDMLNAAQTTADWLIAHRQMDEKGRVFWHTPTPQDRAPGAGYAHGTAGVADMLLALWQATQESRYREITTAAAQWLEHHAVPIGSDGTLLQWATVPNGPQVTYWCHGATGIAPFFLNAARTALTPYSSEIARRAQLTVAGRGASLAPSLCHGVAGTLRTLLYAHFLVPTPQSLAECQRLGEVLLAYLYRENNRTVTPSDLLGAPHPGYMTGYSGVALTLSLLYQTLTSTIGEVPYVA